MDLEEAKDRIRKKAEEPEWFEIFITGIIAAARGRVVDGKPEFEAIALEALAGMRIPHQEGALVKAIKAAASSTLACMRMAAVAAGGDLSPAGRKAIAGSIECLLEDEDEFLREGANRLLALSSS